MKKSMETVFRILFLFVYIFSMVPAQTVSAAPMKQSAASPAAPAPIQSAIGASASVEVKPAKSEAVAENAEAFKPVKSPLEIAQQLKLLGYTTPSYGVSSTQNGLTITPITAYNLIVDSNVLTPASYGPSAATIGATFCNSSATDTLTNVWAYTGDYDHNYNKTLGDSGDKTVGVFPRRYWNGTTQFYDGYNSTSDPFYVSYASGTNILTGKSYTDFGEKNAPYTLKLETGSTTAANDGQRYIGTLGPKQCSTQYWLVSYPRIACTAGPCAYNSAGATNVTGDVKPSDDLWLPYFFWGTSTLGTNTADSWRWNAVTMRNEISAMANKIWPNGDNKVPPEYIAAIQQQLGWDTWTPNGSGTTAYPGETVTSQGIWYDLGVVGAGFDNNGDFTPDRNFWVQPIGDAMSYDPGCFRLVRTYGLWIIKLTDGTEVLKAFVNQMYYENVRDDNNGAVGLVFYQYVALDGACTAGLTPYQEVASGYDNEKFNADFGAGVPPLQSTKPEMGFVKTAPGTVASGGTIVYTMTFTLPDVDTTSGNGTTVTIGNATNGAPLTYYEEVPIGLQYVACSAYYDASLASPYYPGSCPVGTTAKVTMANYTSSTVDADVLFSTNGGVTWTATDPGNIPSTADNPLKIQWRLRGDVKSPDNGSTKTSGSPVTGTLKFSAVVPTAYVPKQVTNEKSCIGIPPAYDTNCAPPPTTLILGNNAIIGTVWKDDGLTGGVAGNGVIDGTEGAISNVPLRLYWDANGDGDYTDSYTVINGYMDVNGDGKITGDDDGTISGITITDGVLGGSLTSFMGYSVYSGLIDINGSGSVTTTDDGVIKDFLFATTTSNSLGGYCFGGTVTGTVVGTPGCTYSSSTGLPDANTANTTTSAANPRYLIAVDATSSNIPTGYGPSTTTAYTKVLVPTTGTLYGDTQSNEPSNFGFMPALSVSKSLVTASTVAEGAPVQFKLTVSNNLPGNGTSGSACTYNAYATSEGSKSTGLTDGLRFDDTNPRVTPMTTANVFTAPQLNGIYSVADYQASGNLGVDGIGFAMANQGGSITNVKARVKLYINSLFNDGVTPGSTSDWGSIEYWAGATLPTTPYASTLPYPYNTSTQAQQNATTLELQKHLGIANAGWFDLDLGSTNAATGQPWTWADLAAGNTIHIVYVGGKQGSGDAVLIFVDAIALQVTTDQTCGNDGTILNPVPLVDRYDPNYLTFVSSEPPITGGPTVIDSSTSEIKWANVGALQPGENKYITVNFTAKAPIVSPGTYNCDGSTNAKFANGFAANSDPVPTSSFSADNNCAPVIITSMGSISGYIWYDKANDGWESGSTTGYNTGLNPDPFIPGVTVTLYACTNASNVLYTTAGTTAAANGKQCLDQTGGKWLPMGSVVTDSSGNYKFDDLAEGFYYVGVTTLPTGAANRGEADDANRNQSGTPQVSGGDNIWGAPSCTGGNCTTADLQRAGPVYPYFNYLSPGEDINNVNFGYNGFTPALYGYVWQDFNGDGVWQKPDETGFNGGVTVTLYDCGTSTSTTCGTSVATHTVDARGFYQFDGLTYTGTNYYRVAVNTGTLPSGSWANTDEDAPSGSADVVAQGTNGNSILITPDILAGDMLGGFNFGYHQYSSSGYSIGDTLFYDWNGNAVQDSFDEGMPKITVKLYKDLNSNGVVDNTDPLSGETETLAYPVIGGQLDLNNDGVINSSDSGTYTSRYTTFSVSNGLLAVNNFLGYKVVSGSIDINGDGVIDSNDTLNIGQYLFNQNLVIDATAYIVKVDTADSDFPSNVTETKDPSEYIVRAGYIDLNRSTATDINVINSNDSGYIGSVHIVSGGVDIDNNGVINSLDNGTFRSYTVTSGLVMVSGSAYTGTMNTYCTICDSQNNIKLAGASNLDQDFGYQPKGSGTIGDTVFKDMNGNGVQDTGEEGISGVTVELRVDKNGDGNYVLLSTQVTNSSGQYLFSGLAAGTYRVNINLTNTVYTNQTAIPNDPLGYDYQPSFTYPVITKELDINKDGAITTADDYTNISGVKDSTGAIQAGADVIDGLIDVNGDGHIGDGTTYPADNGTYNGATISNGYVTVNITNPNYPVITKKLDINLDGAITTADDYTNISGVKDSTGTSQPGADIIDGLIDVDGNGSITSADDGTFNGAPIVDGYVQPANFYRGVTLATNTSSDLDADFPFSPPAAIGDTVYRDVNGNGSQDPGEPGIAGAVVTLYKFTDAGNGISGYQSGDIFFDKAGGTTGVYDAGEPYYDKDKRYEPGEAVSSAVSTATTDSSGNYIFANLEPGYYVVAVTSLPGGYDPTSRVYLSGDPSTDGYSCLSSASNPLNNPSDPNEPNSIVCDARDGMYLYNDTRYMGADFGYLLPGSVGDTVWMDVNSNGVRDYIDSNNNGVHDQDEPYTEAGIPNITITLLNCGGDAICGTSDDGSFTTQETNADGQYFFTGLADGTYKIKVGSKVIAGKLDINGDGIISAKDAGTESGCTVTAGLLSVCTKYNGYNVIGGYIDTNGNGNTPATAAPNTDLTDNLEISDSQWPLGLPMTPVYDPDASANNSPSLGGVADGQTIIVVSGGVVTSVGSSAADRATSTVCDTATHPNGCDPSADSDKINLDADFGYKYSGGLLLSGTICLETTVDGFCGDNNVDSSGVGSGETAYKDVTVFLYKAIGEPFTDSNSNGIWDFEPYTDTNFNGKWDTGEPFTDLNNNGSYNYEPFTDSNGNGKYDFAVSTTLVATQLTNSSGDYAFNNIPNGTYYIVAIGAPQSGLDLSLSAGTNTTATLAAVNSGGDGSETASISETQSSDGSTLAAYQVVEVANNDTSVTDRDFAFKLNGSYDFGDLPESYSTTIEGVPDGARALVPATPNLYLGPETGCSPSCYNTQSALVDTNGVPTVDASGDGADENGVTLFTTNDAKGLENYDGWADGVGQLQFDIVAPASGGFLIGWMDFNGDGTFNQANEMVINQKVYAGQDQNLLIRTPTTNFNGSRIGGSIYVYARFRLFPNDPGMDNLAYSGEASNGEVEDYRLPLAGILTPVTLSYFRAQRQGSAVNFEWSTATESGNVGFNLYVEAADGGMLQINDELIPSNTTDSLDRQDYSYSIDVGGNTFYIEEVSVFGETRRHGPYQLGEKYGEQVEMEKIDQAAITAENQVNFAKRQNDLKKGMKIPDAALQAAIGSQAEMQLTTSLNLKVRKTGLYRVTYEMLRDAGLDLAGVPIAKIALTNRGQMIPVYVDGTGKFGPGGYVEFYGEALDTIYTDTNIYTLQVSKSPADRIQGNSANIGKGLVPPTSYTETLVVNNQRAYANYAPGADAWYDTGMLATTPKTWSFPFQINGLVNNTIPQSLELVVWGAIDQLAFNPDHHLKVSINGVSIANQWFDGLVEQTIKVNLPVGILREGSNTLQLTLPMDTGSKYDSIIFDKFSLSYQRSFQAQNGRLTFTATGKVFNVSNLLTSNVVVYRLDQKGLARLAQVNVQKIGATYTASFAGTNQADTYLVSTVDALYTPTLEAVRLAPDLNQSAQYLIISHPDFIAGLQPLIQAKQAQGLTVSVVDVTDLYTQYSYGIFDPQAIQKYIAYAKQSLGIQYVLLVGGDTYDYRNYLGKNSFSFIPSLYAETGPLSRFVPVDPLYADVNNDNVPDLAIGRFPVRTRAELDLLIKKTLDYASKNYERTAVFASDLFGDSVSFKDNSLSLSSSLPANWSSQSIHMDDMSVANAQKKLIAAMNIGSALVTYTGHSSATSWSYSSLFLPKHAEALTNAGRPFVVVQWGCFNTYYVDPVNKTFVQSFLFAGDRGAVALLGASTRTDSESERLLGILLTPRLTAPGMTVGQAVYTSKVELAKTYPKLLDVLLGWTLMGDPALVVQP